MLCLRIFRRVPGHSRRGPASLSLEVRGSVHVEKAFSSNREFENNESKELRVPAAALNASLRSLGFLGGKAGLQQVFVQVMALCQERWRVGRRRRPCLAAFSANWEERMCRTQLLQKSKLFVLATNIYGVPSVSRL